MNTYEIVTERIIELLEHGVVPWRRPWSAAGAPRNLMSKKQYRGVNFFLLSATKYVSPFWFTLKQANDVLRYYRLWNVEQCDLPQGVLDKLPKVQTYQHDPIEAAERIIASMPNPPEIEFAGTKAFYSPTADRITLPPRELFSSAEELYATLNHEGSHYADFRIMPRNRKRALCGRVLPARHVGIIRQALLLEILQSSLSYLAWPPPFRIRRKSFSWAKFTASAMSWAFLAATA